MRDGKWKCHAAAAFTVFLTMTGMSGIYAQAAVEDTNAAKAYDRAANLQDTMDSLDVVLKETTMIPGQTETVKTIKMKVSGMQSEKDMEVSISVATDDGEKTQYYSKGYFYTDQSGEKIKYKMDKSEMLQLMNYDVYLNFDSGRLSSLDTSDKNGGTVYTFSATPETIGDYADKFLEGVQEEHKVDIIAVQGTMNTDAENHVTKRQMQTVYTLQSDEGKQACIMDADMVFNNPGEDVKVVLPDLSSYKVQGKKEAAVEITAKNQTVYAAEDVNIRAQNNITSAILGVAGRSTALAQTGYTSDGWIQISYNNAVGYVSADYISETKPVTVADMSGTMYATTTVNIRDAAGVEGAILGSLGSGESITVTGYADNDWIRVKYKGHTAYISAAYLSWEEPVRSGYLSGQITGITSSSITVTDPQNGVYTFTTVGAYMNVVDGMVIGDRVDVAYKYSGGEYTATQVNDYTYHDEEEDGEASDLVYGVVMTYGMNALTISLDNGSSMSFIKDDNLYTRGQIYVGAYVSVGYYYNSSIGAYQMTYLSAV